MVVGSGTDAAKIILQDYAGFDEKPMIFSNISGGAGERYKLIEPEEYKRQLAIQPGAGDSNFKMLNFMEREIIPIIRRNYYSIEAQTEKY